MKKRTGRQRSAINTRTPGPAGTGLFRGARKAPAELFAILLLVLLTYGNGIRNDYNLDDAYVVSLDDSQTQAPKGLAAIPEILTSKYSEGPGATYGYRPLSKITLAVEYSLWGNDPHLSHLVNALLFAVNVFLLLLFFRHTGKIMGYRDEPVILAASLLFIVHPIHTEVVSSIKNREEILCFIFLLLALLAFLKYLGSDRPMRRLTYLALAFAGLIFSLLSKQTGFNFFGLMVLLLAHRVLFASGETPSLKTLFRPGLLLRYGLPILFTGILLVFMLDYIPEKIGDDDMATKFESSPYDFAPPGHTFPIFIQTWWFYLKKLLVPFPLLFYYGYDMLPLPGWNNLLPYAGIACILGLAALCIFLLRRKKYFAVFGIGFLLVTLLPFSNPGKVFFYVVGIVGERMAYQASAAWCLLWAMLAGALAGWLRTQYPAAARYSRTQVLAALLAPFLIAYLLLTWNRNAQWKDKMTLFTHDMRWLERSARANFMTGSHILFQYRSDRPGPETEQARRYLQQALQVYPDYDDAQLALGTLYGIYYRANDSALYYLQRVDSLTMQTYIRARERIGDVYVAQQQPDSALAYYRQALAVYPKNYMVYRKMTELLIRSGRYDDVLLLADRAIQYGWPTAYLYRGDVWLSRRDTLQAVANYEQAVSLGLRDAYVLQFLQEYQRNRRKPGNAVEIIGTP